MKELTSYIKGKIKKGNVNWDTLSIDYILNEEFLREHSESVNWRLVGMVQDISDEFRVEMILKGKDVREKVIE